MDVAPSFSVLCIANTVSSDTKHSFTLGKTRGVVYLTDPVLAPSFSEIEASGGGVCHYVAWVTGMSVRMGGFVELSYVHASAQ